MTQIKTLSDLKFQDTVIHVSAGDIVDVVADKYFKEIFNPKKEVKVNFLFQEDGSKVYEAYQDSGSVDYIYLVK